MTENADRPIDLTAGQTFNLPVSRSSAFVTLTPDITAIYGLPSGHLALMALAFEGATLHQVNTVVLTPTGELGLQPSMLQGRFTITELGGIKLGASQILDVAVTLLEAAIKFNMVTLQEVNERMAGFMPPPAP